MDIDARESCEKKKMVNRLDNPRLTATGIPIAMQKNNAVKSTSVFMGWPLRT
jgi:hypothetical protein